jgi:hypothetical protein
MKQHINHQHQTFHTWGIFTNAHERNRFVNKASAKQNIKFGVLMKHIADLVFTK